MLRRLIPMASVRRDRQVRSGPQARTSAPPRLSYRAAPRWFTARVSSRLAARAASSSASPLLQPRGQLGGRPLQTHDLALELFHVGGSAEPRLPPRLLAHQLRQPPLQPADLHDEAGVARLGVGEVGLQRRQADRRAGRGR